MFHHFPNKHTNDITGWVLPRGQGQDLYSHMGLFLCLFFFVFNQLCFLEEYPSPSEGRHGQEQHGSAQERQGSCTRLLQRFLQRAFLIRVFYSLSCLPSASVSSQKQTSSKHNHGTGWISMGSHGLLSVSRGWGSTCGVRTGSRVPSTRGRKSITFKSRGSL